MRKKLRLSLKSSFAMLLYVVVAACQAPAKTNALNAGHPIESSESAVSVETAPSTDATDATLEQNKVGEVSAPVQTPPEPTPAAPNSNAELFSSIAKVLQSPRCLNCHVAGDTPKQGDDRRDHMPLVKRGSDGRGSGLTCNVCHQSTNGPVAPGAPDWHLAPVSMSWEGLSTAELCRTLTETTKNGGRDLNALAQHLTTDPLVQWGWEPGGTRKPVPISRDEFAKQVNAWVAAGGACPN